jgi:hypothetical protein
MAYGNLLDGEGWQPMMQGGSMGGYSPMAPSSGSSMNLLSGGNALATPVRTTTYTFGGIKPYGNVLSPNRPDELDGLARGGYDAPPSMTSAEAEQAASVVNAENAPEVAGLAMGLGQGPMSAVMGKAAQGITSAMKDHLGPYGVGGLAPNPQVGTPAFAQATPAMDTAPGFTDAGARASAFSNMDLSPQARFGGQPAPTPNMMGGIPGFSDALGAFSRDSGLSSALGGLFGDPNAVDPAAALGEVASGRAGDGRGGLQGFAERGFGTDVFGRDRDGGDRDGNGRDGSGRDGGGGRGTNGGMGGGVGDAGAGNPGGTGVL